MPPFESRSTNIHGVGAQRVRLETVREWVKRGRGEADMQCEIRKQRWETGVRRREGWRPTPELSV